MFDLSIHRAGEIRCRSFYPENDCGVSLGTKDCEKGISFYGLPYEKALALALIFADSETALYFRNGSEKLLDYLPQLAARREALNSGEPAAPYAVS